MKNGKSNFGFSYIYIWQILKRFAGTFRRAEALKLRGVIVAGGVVVGLLS